MPHSQNIIANDSFHFQHVLKKTLLFHIQPTQWRSIQWSQCSKLKWIFVWDLKMCPVLQLV